MQFKRNLLAVSVASVLLQLTACGGGSSEVQATQSLSGSTADGYLVNAQVCLDLNDNMACDVDEPTTTSEESGKYAFEELPADLDLSQTSVVVEVIPGVTYDEDDPTAEITEGYTLTAPAGVSRFISPLTTMLATEIEENPELTPEEAQVALERKLRMEGTGASLLDDYVAGKVSNETKAETYRQVHKIAQVVAKTVAKSLKAVEENDETLGDTSHKELRRAIVSTLAQNIDDVVTAIDEAALSDEQLTLTDVITDLSASLPLSAEAIRSKVEERREQKQKSKVDYATLLEMENGLYLLDGRVSTLKDQDQPSCKLESTLVYKNRYLDDEGSIQRDQYNYVDGTFELQTPIDKSPLHWVDGQWQAVEQETVTDTEEESTIELVSGNYGKQHIKAAEMSLAGHKIQFVTQKEKPWDRVLDNQTQFAEGAMGYRITRKQLEDVSILRVDNCDSEPCNTVKLAEGDATALDQLLNPAETEFADQIQIKVVTNGEITLKAALFGEPGATSGELLFFREKAKGCDNKCLKGGDEKQSWTRTDKGIELNLPGWVKSHTDLMANTLILTEHDGYVRKAYSLSQGTVTQKWAFNKVALDQLVAGIDSEQVVTDLPLSACGLTEQEPKDEAEPEGEAEEELPQVE